MDMIMWWGRASPGLHPQRELQAAESRKMVFPRKEHMEYQRVSPESACMSSITQTEQVTFTYLGITGVCTTTSNEKEGVNLKENKEG